MENSETLKIFINEEIFGLKNLLTITGKIEISESKKGNYFAKELIYLSFTESYNTNSTTTMQLKGIDVYNLANALEETLMYNSSQYKKFTDSSKSKNIKSNERKFIAVNKDGEKIFINLNIAEEKIEKFKTILYVAFERYEVKGIIRTLDAFMQEYKTNLYKTQRFYEKLNKKKKRDINLNTNKDN